MLHSRSLVLLQVIYTTHLKHLHNEVLAQKDSTLQDFRITVFFFSHVAGAEQVYFILPKLDFSLLSTVNIKSYEGGALLTFIKVEMGHQAKYVCIAEDRVGRKKIKVFEIKVLKKDNDLYMVGEGGVDRRDWEMDGNEREDEVDNGMREGEWGVGDVGMEGEVGVGGREGGEVGDDGVREGGEIGDDDRVGVLRGEDDGGAELEENAGRVVDAEDRGGDVPFFETMEDRAQVSIAMQYNNIMSFMYYI